MGAPYPVDIKRLGNVFGAPAAHTCEHLAATAVCGHDDSAADKDATGDGHRLKPCGDINAVAVRIAIILDDITEVDAYAQLKRAVVEPLLYSKGRINGFVDAWKHRQKPVPGRLEGA